MIFIAGKWQKFVHLDYSDVRKYGENRTGQNRKRVRECESVFKILEKLNHGEMDVKADLVLGNEAFINSVKSTLDLDNVCLAGHSFGGTTSTTAAFKSK